MDVALSRADGETTLAHQIAPVLGEERLCCVQRSLRRGRQSLPFTQVRDKRSQSLPREPQHVALGAARNQERVHHRRCERGHVQPVRSQPATEMRQEPDLVRDAVARVPLPGQFGGEALGEGRERSG